MPLKNGCRTLPSADLVRYSISASSDGSTQIPHESVFHSMSEPLPILMESAPQIAWDYLDQTCKIDDPKLSGWLLLDAVEHMVRRGWLCRTAPSRLTNALERAA
jgi:hypothetical protein